MYTVHFTYAQTTAIIGSVTTALFKLGLCESIAGLGLLCREDCATQEAREEGELMYSFNTTLVASIDCLLAANVVQLYFSAHPATTLMVHHVLPKDLVQLAELRKG